MKSSTMKSSGKSSAVIKPGTGSGSRPNGGSTKTPMSDPSDKHTLGRKPAGKTLK